MADVLDYALKQGDDIGIYIALFLRFSFTSFLWDLWDIGLLNLLATLLIWLRTTNKALSESRPQNNPYVSKIYWIAEIRK